MPKIPTVYEGDEDEIGTESMNGGLSNEVVESLAQNYFEFKTKELELAERLTTALLDTVKFGIEAIREESRLNRNYRSQSEKRHNELQERNAQREHEKWAASQARASSKPAEGVKGCIGCKK